MKRIILAAALVLAVTLPAHAQHGSLTRSFVSSSGSDTNPCTITAPCASFAQAYTKIGANGIIAALDPGKYGPLTGTSAITSGVTINGNGWAAITAPAGGNGITVNANTANADIVHLNGLEIDGAGAGANGIVFNSGGAFTVSNCTIENFVGTLSSGNAILIQPNTTDSFTFYVNDSVLADNQSVGLFYDPQVGDPNVNLVADHVKAKGNSIQGFRFDTEAAGGSTNVTISNSVASENFDGIFAIDTQGTMTLSLDNTLASNNQGTGIEASGPVNVLLGRSFITGNAGAGIYNGTSGNGNTFFSYNNNQINGNSPDIATGTGTSPLRTTPLQ
jgi:Right handed beta helix region